MNKISHAETFNIEPDSEPDSVEKINPSFEPETPEQIWTWIDDLEKTRSPRELWGLRGVIDRHAPGADKADEALVLRLQGKIAGASLLAPDYLIGAFVLPEHQKQGLGQRLIQESIERLRARGSKRILVEVCDQRALRIIQNLPDELQSILNIKESFRDD